MKRLVLLFSFISFFFTAQSQLTKDNWLSGGTGKFYAYKSQYSSATYSNEASYTEIDLSPNIGYFVADKLAFGIRPSFSSIKGEVAGPGGGRTNTRRYAIGPFGRFYFLNPDRQFNLLTDISYQYGITKVDGKKVGNFNEFSVLLGPVVYFNSSVGLEFLLVYSSNLVDNDQSYSETRKGFQIGVGFQIHLEK